MMRRIRWRWLAVHVLVALSALCVLTFFLNAQLQNYVDSRFRKLWQHELELAKVYLKNSRFEQFTPAQADRWADQIGRILGIRITIVDRTGVVVGDSDVALAELPAVENHLNRPEIQKARETGFGSAERLSSTVHKRFLYFAIRLEDNDRPRGFLRAAVPVTRIQETKAYISSLVNRVAWFVFAIITIVGFFVSRVRGDRLHRIQQAVRELIQVKYPNQSLGLPARFDESWHQELASVKAYVQQMTRERDQLQAILNSMVEGVVVVDLNRTVVLINDAFNALFDVSKPILHKNIDEVLRHADLLQALNRAIEQKKDEMVPLELQGAYPRVLEAHIAILGSAEEPSGAVVVFHDITQLKLLEKVRRDFVANVSHELRTPLTAIKGYAETLLDDLGRDGISSQQANWLRTIHRHSERMSKLVEDLLILSKVESAQSEQKLETLELPEIIWRVVENLKDLTEKKNLTLKVTISDKLPAVKGIFAEIETVVENLIDNAIKYGARGKEIKITAQELPDAIQVSVADKGIGIPKEDQPRIFERFYRVDKGRSRSLGGTGLGLSIVKHIVQRHGGRIWVESEPGAGAVFSFTLPKAV